MTDHFSGDDLSYSAKVTTTNQRTGKQKTGALNSIARNKVTGVWSGSVLTLTGGTASPQDLTISITASGVGNATATGDFTLSLTDGSEPQPTATPEPEPTATPEPQPTATPVPQPTATPVPQPTATPVPQPTATPEPEPTATPEPQGPTLTNEFDDLTKSHQETEDIDMSAHFSGDNLTYDVQVTTTHQRTGKVRTGALNTIARNKVTGSLNGSVLTLTAGHASSQQLTIEVTASNADGNASVSFTFTLDN